MMVRRGPVAALVALLAAGAVAAVDFVVPDPQAPSDAVVVASSTEPVGGGAVCGVGQASPTTSLAVVASRPDDDRDTPATVEYRQLQEGAGAVQTLPSVFPGGAASVELEPTDAARMATAVRWRDAPAAVWREWRISGNRQLPDATVAGPCAPTSSPQWIVPGLSTEGGDEARLRLSNPYASAATVAIGFLTPGEAAEPLVLRNLSVPAGSVREIIVNDTLPEEADLSAIVQVASGRMSVEGVQISRAAIGGVDGASLLQAAPEPAEEWTVPWVSDGARSTSWLWIANPGVRTAAVELMLHTPAGGELPQGLTEVSVPPGQMRRVDLAGTFPEDVRTAAVTARSNGAPIVVSGATRLQSGDPEDASGSGIAVQLGATAADASWVISGAAGPDRSEEVHLVNPTGVDASVDISVFNGVVALQPEQFQQLAVPAGSTRVVELDSLLNARSLWSAFVTTSEGAVVVGRVGRTVGEDEPLRLVAVTGVPSQAWSSTATGLAARELPGMVRSLGTAGPGNTADDRDGAAPGDVDPVEPDDELDGGQDVGSDGAAAVEPGQ